MEEVNEQREDRDLIELLQILDTATPIIPDSLMDYYMMKAGVTCDDVRLKRLIALLGQKFVSDIANDAMHFNRMRQANVVTSSTASNVKGGPSVGGGGNAGSAKRITLTIEDLSAALAEYGINVKKPSYYM